MSATFSWNLYADLQDMWSATFMVNAFRAGTIVAVLAGVIGWFMVLRRQSFAGHTLAVVGFPGAAAAGWLGIGLSLGYFTASLLAAVLVAGLADRSAPDQTSLIGTVQAFALANGMLFITLSGGFLTGNNALLFGSFLGITAHQVLILATVATVVLAALILIGCPLLFASVDPDVARAHGVPVRVVGVVFLVLLGATTAEVSQITGALLVFALLVLPPATAQLLTTAPIRSLLLSIGFALVTVWVALFVGYYVAYPIGFWLTTIAFGLFAAVSTATRVIAPWSSRSPGRSQPPEMSQPRGMHQKPEMSQSPEMSRSFEITVLGRAR